MGQADDEPQSTAELQSPAPAAVGRSDVFICYSRRDRDFVARLHGALVAEGKEVYVDWEDIPDWSPDYESELFGGIDAADAFAFVLTPDSLASPHCALELEHAVAQGKRIRPLLRRDTDGVAIPDSLRRPQWIDFRQDASFEAATATLLEAVGVDPEWVQRHTRIGLRAGEWERRGREASFLLRGSDLREAELWLGSQDGKEPPPTPLQGRYVLASRQAATRRTRLTLGAVVVALAVAIGLAVFAVLQRNGAIEQRDQARSIALASAARDQIDDRLEVALLLGLEAYEASPTDEAASVVLDALGRARRSGAERILRGHTDIVWSAAFSPAGDVLASGGDDGTVRFWDTSTWRPLGAALWLRSRGVAALAFDPSGRRLAVGSRDGTVRLIDVAARKQLGAPLLTVDGDRVSGLAFSRDGELLAAAGAAVRLWNVGDGLPTLRAVLGRDRYVDDVSFSPDGRTLAAAGRNGIRLWDVSSGEVRKTLGKERFVYRVAFSPDGRTLASESSGGKIRVWDARSGAPLGRVLAGSDFAFSPNGSTLAVADNDVIRRWNVRTQKPVGSVLRGHVGFASGLAFSADGKLLAVGGDDRTVRIWRLGRTGFGGRLAGSARAVTALAFSPDNALLATGGGRVRLWEVATRKPDGAPLPGRYGQVHAVAFSPDGGTLAAAGEDGTLALWDVATHRSKGNLLTGPSTQFSARYGLNGVAFSPDGRLLAAGGNNGTVRIWDVASRKQVARPLNVEGGVLDVEFSPDGGTLAMGASDGRIYLWDVQRGVLLDRVLRGGTGSIHSVAFSADGRQLAAAGFSGIRLWDTATWTAAGWPLTGLPSRLVFSPDGRLLVYGSSNHVLIGVWSVRTHKQVGAPLWFDETKDDPFRGVVRAVAFSPDGRVLAAAPGGVARLWYGLFWHDTADLRDQVCGLVTGNLGRDEWREYAAGVPYRSSCPA